MVLSVGTALSAAATVPLAGAVGQGWRTGIGVWAVTAALAVGPWLVARVPDAELTQRRAEPRGARIDSPRARPSMFRSPTAWAMAVFFGTQSLGAYVVMGWMPELFRDAGVSATQAGLLLGLTAAGLTFITGGGYLGLALAPATTPWLWATLIGIGNGAFPLALTMIGLRTRTAAYTASLSGFTQSVGYLLAAAGPLAFGALHDATGGWTVPIALTAVLLVPQCLAGLVAGRNRKVEDELSEPRGEVAPEPAIPPLAGVGAR